MASSTQQVGTVFNALTAGSQIVGNIKAVSDIRIDGALEGDLDCTSKIIVGEKGSVRGNIKGQQIEIYGQVVGSVISSGTLAFRSTANVTGEITAQTLVVEPKAIFNGSCKMTNAANPTEKK